MRISLEERKTKARQKAQISYLVMIELLVIAGLASAIMSGASLGSKIATIAAILMISTNFDRVHSYSRTLFLEMVNGLNKLSLSFRLTKRLALDELLLQIRNGDNTSMDWATIYGKEEGEIARQNAADGTPLIAEAGFFITLLGLILFIIVRISIAFILSRALELGGVSLA